MGATRQIAVRLAVVLTLSAFVAACESPRPPLYGWGSYESQIYVSQARPGELTPQDAARRLEQEENEIAARGQRLPPGWHAQLASLYEQIGDSERARQRLLQEKALFPESAVLIDRLIANLDGRSKQ